MTEKKEYIERGAALLAITGQPSELHYPSWYKGNIMEVPAADVSPVVHGEWEIVSESYRLFDDYDESYSVKCPFCERTYYVPFEFEEEKMIAYAREHYPYCHCGAKMDGGTNDR